MRRSRWLALPVSLVVKFSITILLAMGLTSAGFRLPTQSPQDGAAWYLLMGVNLLGAVVAGALASRLSTKRDRVVPAILAAFFLLSAFAGTPPPGVNVWQLLVWALSAPVGAVLGSALVWRSENAA
jgi:MFS family permease